jgi:hypothetical protein
LEGIMSRCERFEELIEQYLAGDIAVADLESLRQHALSCPGCRRMMELHNVLSQIPEQVSQLSEGRLEEMRDSVLGRIRRSGHQHSAPRHRTQPFRKQWLLARASRLVYAVASAIVLLALGFFLGRLGAEREGFDENLFVDEVVRQASLERGLAGYWDSPFIYSNVSFRPQADGTVTIEFDVTRRVTVTRKLESPLTREMLVHAMFDPSAMGARLMAMGVARQTIDEKLKEALIFILLNDPSLPVRLRSLEILMPYASDPAVQDALLVSLAQDPSVQIRLMAVESLAGQHTDPGIVRQALGEPLDESDQAVLHRAVQLMGNG